MKMLFVSKFSKEVISASLLFKLKTAKEMFFYNEKLKYNHEQDCLDLLYQFEIHSDKCAFFINYNFYTSAYTAINDDVFLEINIFMNTKNNSNVILNTDEYAGLMFENLFEYFELYDSSKPNLCINDIRILTEVKKLSIFNK